MSLADSLTSMFLFWIMICHICTTLRFSLARTFLFYFSHTSIKSAFFQGIIYFVLHIFMNLFPTERKQVTFSCNSTQVVPSSTSLKQSIILSPPLWHVTSWVHTLKIRCCVNAETAYCFYPPCLPCPLWNFVHHLPYMFYTDLVVAVLLRISFTILKNSFPLPSNWWIHTVR